ncbi:MAG: carboxypeptidase-like regulatory domain-containing protein [Flavobacteriales bacterium]
MKFLLVILAILLSQASYGHGGATRPVTVLSGNVLESGTTEQLTGVKVSVAGTDLFTYTDRYGYYEIPNVPAGQIVIEFSLVSFEPSKVELDLTNGDLPVANATLESR